MGCCTGEDMGINEVVEQSLRSDERFRNLTVTPERCEYCDGTGDVHSFDGEWRGECHECGYWERKK